MLLFSVFCSLVCSGQIWGLEVQVSSLPRENLEHPTTHFLAQINAEDHFMTHQLLVSNIDSFKIFVRDAFLQILSFSILYTGDCVVSQSTANCYVEYKPELLTFSLKH